MECCVLGPVEALDGERRLPLGGPKQRALAGVLLLAAGRVVPRDELVEAVWPEGPPGSAAAAVQVYVSRLRKALPAGRLETRPPGYLLRLEAGELDAERFERLADEGRRALGHDEATAAARLRDALALWRGPVLGGLELGGSARAEAHRLEELRATVLGDRVDAELALGLHHQLVGELEALLDRDPLRERLRGQLMLALYRAGRQAEALDAYHQGRRALRETLGIEPDAALRRLHTAILRQSPELDLGAQAAERTQAVVLFAVLTPGGGDAGAVRDLLARGFDLASRELRAAGATVEEGLAGALLAVFEAEAAHALAAAVALRARLAAEFGDSLRARIGIEAGEVLAGRGGMTGTPVAVASRLAGAARPGEILVGDASHLET